MTDASEVRDNAGASRYELQVDGHVAFLQYRDSPGGARVLVHTEVAAELEGRGIGGRLVKAALEDAKAQNRRVVPSCPFVASYIERHAEYQGLVALT